MNNFTKFALFACLGLTAAVVPRPVIADEIAKRLDALERENAALRARLNRLETSRTAKLQQRPVETGSRTALAPLPPAQSADNTAADLSYKAGPRVVNPPRFEVSGSLSFLQPGAGNLEYGTLTTPLPLPTPNWTHLHANTTDSFAASPTQMVGPPFLIGPESALYKLGSGAVSHSFDAVDLDAGHTFCAECFYQFRAFGGVEVARIGI